MTSPSPVSTIDVRHYGGDLIAARAAAIRDLVDVTHLDPLDAQLHVDGQLGDAWFDATRGIGQGFEAFLSAMAAAMGAIGEQLRALEVAPDTVPQFTARQRVA